MKKDLPSEKGLSQLGLWDALLLFKMIFTRCLDGWWPQNASVFTDSCLQGTAECPAEVLRPPHQGFSTHLWLISLPKTWWHHPRHNPPRPLQASSKAQEMALLSTFWWGEQEEGACEWGAHRYYQRAGCMWHSGHDKCNNSVLPLVLKLPTIISGTDVPTQLAQDHKVLKTSLAPLCILMWCIIVCPPNHANELHGCFFVFLTDV